MGYKYPQNDPHWVEAESVEAASPKHEYVNVKCCGKTYQMCRVEWSNLAFDKTKSDVLVEDATERGSWGAGSANG